MLCVVVVVIRVNYNQTWLADQDHVTPRRQVRVGCGDSKKLSSYCLACCSSVFAELLGDKRRKLGIPTGQDGTRIKMSIITSVPVVLERLLDFDSRSKSVKMDAQTKQRGILAHCVCNVHFDLVSQDL